MSALALSDLPAEILAEILKHLDWRSRIKCESISRQFRQVCTEVCTAAAYPYSGIPDRMTFVVTNFGDTTKFRWNFNTDRIEVVLREEESTIEGVVTFLKSVLQKWAPQIELLELCNLNLRPEMMAVLNEYGQIIPRFKFRKCRLIDVPFSLVAKMKHKLETDPRGRSALICTACIC